MNLHPYLIATTMLSITMTVVGLPATAHAAPACGGMNDFDGDGHKDIVVGSPNATVGGVPEAGRVQIRLSAGGVVNLSAPGIRHAGDHFGTSVGDVDLSSGSDALNSCSSLVVGAPDQDVNGEVDAGAVYVYPTLASAPTRLDQDFNEEAPGVQARAHFGALITEQSTGDAEGELNRAPVLYASAPDYDLGAITDAGVVQRITLTMAESGRPSVASVETITQDAGFRSAAEPGDHFGAAMSATPFPDELLVGAPGESVGGATRTGAITFWTPESVQYLHQDSAGIPGAAETGDGFGSTIFLGSEVDMAAQRIGEDQAMRLFVSAPFEDVNGQADAGALTQLVLDPPLRQGTRSKVIVSGARSWTQDSAGVAGGAEAGDRFGVAVGSLDLQPSDENGGNIPDPGAPLFVAGAPGEDTEGVVDAGAVLSLGENRWYDEATPGVPGTRGKGDRFGARLGAARDFGIGAPGPGTWSRGLLVGVPGNATGDGAVVVGLPNKRVTAGTLLTPPALDGGYGSALGSTR